MYDIQQFHQLVREARRHAYLTQRDMAELVGTSQSAIASLESGQANPTVDTIARCLESAGFSLRVTLEPLPVSDAVVERYKRDVDRTLLRENLRLSVDERLRRLSEWQQAGSELQRATSLAKQARKTSPRRAE